MGKANVGWHVPSFPVDGSRASEFVDQITETLGYAQEHFDSAWMDDHFIPWGKWQSPETPYLECISTMSYLAGAFTQIKFGSSVLCQSYRNPALMAKTAANLQLLTQGRFLFGIGAGWLEEEYAAYDYEFPRPAVRIAQLEETVEIVRRMWTSSPASYEGKYYQIHNAHCDPMPDPVPPILIGGGGEQLTLRVVAKHADWWNIPGGTLENYVHKLDVLRQHCDDVGRDFDEIVKSWSLESVSIAQTTEQARAVAETTPYQNHPIYGTPDEIAATLRTYLDAGVDYLIFRFVDFPSMEGMKLFVEEVMPQLYEIEQ